MKLQKGKHLSRERAMGIIDAAGIILSGAGIKVTDAECLKVLKGKRGIEIKGDRAHISISMYEEFLAGQKRYKTKPERHGSRLHGEASLYTYQYRDVGNGKINRFTSETLKQQAEFIEKARRIYPLNPVVPGYPTDVPPQLASVSRYKIAAETCSYGWPMVPDSVKAAEYMFEMTQVMGQKMTHLPVYMISPLTLGGDSFDIVLKNSSRLESFYTFSMPNIGVTTPMNFSMGMGMALAEVAGGAILVEALTGLKGEIKPNLFPFDLKNFNLAFGSPEKFLYEQIASELSAYIREDIPDYSSTNIHTFGKNPDGRTGIEKGMMIMAGAMCGARRFYCIGTLSMDELFDPLQMIQDAEAISFAQRILDGVIEDEIAETMEEEVQEGLESGFVCSDRSLDDYDKYLVSPEFSPKDSLQKWIQDGKKTSRELLQDIYYEILNMPRQYRLGKEQQQDLERIYAEALRLEW